MCARTFHTTTEWGDWRAADFLSWWEKRGRISGRAKDGSSKKEKKRKETLTHTTHIVASSRGRKKGRGSVTRQVCSKAVLELKIPRESQLRISTGNISFSFRMEHLEFIPPLQIQGD
jgi:hypothetical protein